MRLFFSLAFAFVLANAAFGANEAASRPWPNKDDLQIEAVVITAGPYGEWWTLKYPNGDGASLEIRYMLGPMGNMSGSFFADEVKIQKLAQLLRTNRFDKLRKNISPKMVPFHAPDFRLKITSMGKSHDVTLYYPDGLEESDEARRFVDAWKATFDLVPLRPVAPSLKSTNKQK